MPGHSAGNSGSHNKKQKWPSNGPSPAKRTRGLANTPEDPRPKKRVWLGEPSRPKEKLPGKPNYFSKLPVELYLEILELLHGEDILSLRETNLKFYAVLKDPKSDRLWDVIREDAGILLAENRPPLPTLDEIQLAKYVLQSHCMKFDELYGDTFSKKEQAKDAIGWFYPGKFHANPASSSFF
ncbi:hypothetical protein M407DRAFT_29988 [Tulasnella calospora MUT 4182]|uniref:F-box domain-containing protein n=1 Tax=Tulasnella calospora MUT 4182 TaxID=1051891 RepID=A0A0C3Q838_9AGAM|nr:hypothetical protein M407DRAFT_29988 [Tulasnella calospora MUT 4182]